MTSTVSPYSTALELQRPKPTYVKSKDDQERVSVYNTYEDIFNNVKEAFAVKLRSPDGEEIGQRFVPAARTIIEATNRYLAKSPELVMSVPADVTMADQDLELFSAYLEKQWKREEVGVKFASIKRWMLIRGDALLHLSADPSKEEGSRIRVTELDPSTYFPIHDNIDPERVNGAYIVTIVLDDGGEEIAQRIEYRKIRTAEDAAAFPGSVLGGIFYRRMYFEKDGWDDRAPEFTAEDLTAVDTPAWAAAPAGTPDPATGYALPSQITSIPVYHFRNNRRGTEPFGLSELQGIETILAGLTQTLTDEDLAMALAGIGVYVTDSGSPKDEQGNEQDWVIAPASVLELERDTKFARVEGVTTLEPMIQHTEQLNAAARETSGTPDVAIGRVDVQVVESGVALAISMAPIISKNQEKEEELKSKMDQFLYDLVNMWLPAYEAAGGNGVVVEIHFADPLPVNRKDVVSEVTELVKNKVIPIRFALQILKDKLGYDIDPEKMAAEVQAEQAAALDAAGARLDAEAGGGAIA